MRYYVLKTPAGDEVVRVSRGTAMYFDPRKGRWIPDPLLALEVRLSADWREVAPHELPPAVADIVDAEAPARKAGGLRRGRHSRR